MGRLFVCAVVGAVLLGACAGPTGPESQLGAVEHESGDPLAREARAELQRLLAFADDERFLLELAGSLEKLGLRQELVFGNTIPLAHEAMLTLPRLEGGPAEIAVERGERGAQRVETYENEAWPFLVFVTEAGVVESVPSADELATAVAVVGLPSGRLALLRFKSGTVSFVGKQRKTK